jgi:uncharacterized protein (DUF58 family)
MRVVAHPRVSLASRLGSRLRGVATYDFFPSVSAKIRRIVYSPLGILILAALVAIICGFFLHSQGFVLFAGIVTIIALGVAWPWLSLWGLRGTITFGAARAVEQDSVQVNLDLSNRLPWPAYGLALQAGLRDQTTEEIPQSVSISSVPGGRPARGQWCFTPARRGVYPLRPPLLTTAFPFGLWETKRSLSNESPLLVWPRTVPVGPAPTISGQEQVEGNVSRNKVGTNGDVLGVRPFRRGDSPRRIHWGQSARHDRLIVCELQSNARPVVQLILDADPSVHAGQGPDGSREWAIRIVASLAKGWIADGVEVSGAWNGQVIPLASGSKQVNALLDSLTRLPDQVKRSLSEIMASPACRSFTHGPQVIITTDVGLLRSGLKAPVPEHQRWVVLRSQGFAASASPLTSALPLPLRPWLEIDYPEQVSALLRGGWKEAYHGS